MDLTSIHILQSRAHYLCILSTDIMFMNLHAAVWVQGQGSEVYGHQVHMVDWKHMQAC